MATVILVRHGRTTANSSGVLAGRTSGVHLDDLGRTQAQHVGGRLAGLPLAAVVSSPLERCRETADAILGCQGTAADLVLEDDLVEVDYGTWSGDELATLAKDPLWQHVQHHPAGVTFPAGESMAAMSARAVAGVRRWDAAVTAEHGASAVWVAVSHGDVIKAVLADALGMHLDVFQRIVVDPASASVVRYTPGRPLVLCANSHDGDLSWLRPSAGPDVTGSSTAAGDAVVGGGAGPAAASGTGPRG